VQWLWLALAFLEFAGLPARAAVPLDTGPYQAQLWTEPPVIPTGQARIYVALKDGQGKPIPGAEIHLLAKMPDMDMGEREETASPVPERPGTYVAPARFAMEGAYQVTLRVTGPSGEGQGMVPLRTGQNTGGETAGGAGEATLWKALPWIILALVVVFVLFRLRRTGTRLSWRTLVSPTALVALVIVVVAFAASSFAVRAWRRPGSMSLVDALASDMSKMPAPPGQGPVALATVEAAPVLAAVRYTGSAVGYVEQDIYPRVSGWITWMPFYAGDPIRKNQLLAKLDTREYQSRVDERAANRAMAEQMTAIAGLEYQQAQAAASQARAEVRSRQGALEETRRMHSRAQAMHRESQAGSTEARGELRSMQADLTAARHEQAASEAMLQSARAMQPEAEAMLSAMQADQSYWQKQVARLKVLLDNGAVSGEEFQREEAMGKGANAKVRQAEAKLSAVKSDIRAAESQRARAEAMVDSAQGKIEQAHSRIQGMEAKVEQAKAEIAAAAGRIQMAEGDLEAARANTRAMEAMAKAGTGKIRQAQAGVRGAQAALTTASVVRGYTEIRSLVDGVVTQRLISPGVLVNPGQAILKVAQVQPIRLQANVAEADLDRIRVGSRVTVRGQNGAGTPLVTHVTSITPAVDPVARTGTVEALFPNTPRRFLPGQYVRMEIGVSDGRERNAGALRVPVAAIRWQSEPSSGILSMKQAAYVWVAEPASEKGAYTVQRVNVQAGASDGQYTEILSGLQSGQQVVARGQDALRPGDTVVAVPWGKSGPEALPAGSAQPGTGGHGGHGAGQSSAPAPAQPSPPLDAADPHAGHGKAGN